MLHSGPDFYIQNQSLSQNAYIKSFREVIVENREQIFPGIYSDSKKNSIVFMGNKSISKFTEIKKKTYFCVFLENLYSFYSLDLTDSCLVDIVYAKIWSIFLVQFFTWKKNQFQTPCAIFMMRNVLFLDAKRILLYAFVCKSFRLSPFDFLVASDRKIYLLNSNRSLFVIISSIRSLRQKFCFLLLEILASKQMAQVFLFSF